MAKITKVSKTYDYIIVGAGAAGCVLANRLTEDPKVEVLLLEAGKSDKHPMVHIPIGYLYCMNNPRMDWMMSLEAEDALNGRKLTYPRGKLLGGCTSINGMIYMRGQKRDYDEWSELGNQGWSWDEVLPHFRKSENYHGGSSEFHGEGGEWQVSKQRLNWPILDAFVKAANEFGAPICDDFNDGDNEGVGYFEVNQVNGKRLSAAKAFLKPIQNRKNLTVLTEAETAFVELENSEAVSVVYEKNRRLYSVSSEKEIILAAGAINSPKILELSGIGSKEILEQNGIEANHILEGVGKNLQDHLQIRTVFKIKKGESLNEKSHSWFEKAKMGLEYALFQTGPLSMAPSQLGLFTKSDDEQETANLEYHIQPLSADKLGWNLHKFPAVTLSVCNLRPKSVGTSHISSNNFKDAPKIQPNYLSDPEDQRIAVESIKQVRELAKMPVLDEMQLEEFLPGSEISSDEEILKAVGDIATTIFHPVGTCKMGHDEMSVVDYELKVHGISNLRVVDASIMPNIISGNTASPVIMIAEKAAKLIKEAY